MATHSSILAWRILWTEEPGGVAKSCTITEWLTHTHTHTAFEGCASTGTLVSNFLNVGFFFFLVTNTWIEHRILKVNRGRE